MSGKLHEWTSTQRRAATKTADAWEGFFDQQEVEEAESVEATAPIMAVQAQTENELLGLDGVVGVATSLKVSKGKPTSTWCLAVYVVDKQPKTKLPKSDLIPAQIQGVPTDVVEVGEIKPLAFTAKTRPGLPGFSIGHPSITAGTFWAFVLYVLLCCDPNYGCNSSFYPPNYYLFLINNHFLASIYHCNP